MTKHHRANILHLRHIASFIVNYSLFEQFFSSARANRYFTAAGNDSQRAMELYTINLRLAQAFHPLLEIVKVVIRNLISTKLEQHFTDRDWIINQKVLFMSDASLTYTNKKTGKKETNAFLKNEVKKAEKRLVNAGAAVTSGRVLAEQTFGFWTDLFEVHHYRLLSGRPIQIFSFLPAGYGRKEVLRELHSIRRFRNRINHNEPICFGEHVIDFAGAQAVYSSINNILAWIDPQILQFAKDLDNVIPIINAGQSL